MKMQRAQRRGVWHKRWRDRVNAAWRAARRAARVGGGLTIAGVFALLVVFGVADDVATRTPSILDTLLVCALIAFIAVVVSRRLRFAPPSARVQRVSPLLAATPLVLDLEIALAIVVGAGVAIAATGGAASSLHPVMYGVVAFAVTFQRRSAAWLTLAVAVVFEISGAVRAQSSDTTTVMAVSHVAFLGAAAALHGVFVRGALFAERVRRKRALAHDLEQHSEAAREYRLISAALGVTSRVARTRAEEEDMLARGGVQAIRAAVYHELCLLKRSVKARTCVLLWGDGDVLKLKELVTDGDEIVERVSVPAAGAIKAVLRERVPVVLHVAKAAHIPYRHLGDTAAFCGVPILEEGRARGVLCVDRERSFDDDEVALAQAAAEQVMRNIESERVFLAVERLKYEHERFYQASAMLCEALTLEQVMETAFSAAEQIVDYDVAAITLYDTERKRHRVASLRCKPHAQRIVSPDLLVGFEFRGNAGLAAMVVKNRHYLPAGGEVRDTTAYVYTKRADLRGARSLLVLPLVSADEAIGTIMLASASDKQFGEEVRDMLQVIASQVAVSLQNALMYRKMETMATTDGLTGLTNHRAFQERLGAMLERAERFGHAVAVLLCDVDHFKGVNDTHGHPVGDEVLRRVAGVLQEAVRKVDITARYGGEEFAVVLEATDEAGALRLAERIRSDVGNLTLDSEHGQFRVTLSIGAAVFPQDAPDKAMLIEHADHALYHAKETGRNRVVSYRQFSDYRHAKRAS